MGDDPLSLSVDEIREILRIFLDSELQDLRLEVGNVRLAVAKSGAAGLAARPFNSQPARPAASAAAQPIAATEPVSVQPTTPLRIGAAAAANEAWVAVTAPSVGVFYRRPAPDQPPFVEVGSAVAADDPLCLIEIMKMFTGVLAPCAGRIAEIVVENATMVEYGQPLMYIEPAA
jgi:acetyl-CoA carboxylase biotin carboxyl carrier protein